MTCTTCNGNGHVAGRWMPELCPECSAFVHDEDEPMDKGAPGCLFAIVGTALCLCIALTWEVWPLILGVFA